MATKSIFDCDELNERNVPAREQITYDDDLFAFGIDATDEVDKVPQNVSISTKLTQNGKRKANHSNVENGRIFKAAKLNIQVTANGGTRKATKTHERNDEYDLGKEIGSGTYGRVYKAKLHGSNEVIAIKRMTCKLNTENSVNILIRTIAGMAEICIFIITNLCVCRKKIWHSCDANMII